MNKVIVTIVTAVACAVCTLAGTTGDAGERTANHHVENSTRGAKVPLRKNRCECDYCRYNVSSATLAEKFALVFATDFNANKTNSVKIVSCTHHKDGTATFRLVPKFRTRKDKNGEPVRAKDGFNAREVTIRFGMTIIDGEK